MINYCRPPDVIVQDERFSLSASHPLAIISRLYTLIGPQWCIIYSLDAEEAEPYTVTVTMADRTRAIPIVWFVDGSSLRRTIPQMSVRTGWSRIANDVWAAGSLGNE